MFSSLKSCSKLLIGGIAAAAALMLASLAAQPIAISQTPFDSAQALQAKLRTTLTGHLNKLLSDDGSLRIAKMKANCGGIRLYTSPLRKRRTFPVRSPILPRKRCFDTPPFKPFERRSPGRERFPRKA